MEKALASALLLVVSALLLLLLSSTSNQKSLCPKAEDIAPCVCEIREDSSFLDCSEVKNEEELARVFKVEFPTTTIDEFYFVENKGIKVFRNGIFGDISFVGASIILGDLETIEGDAFQNSQLTLSWLRIRYANLLTNFNLDGTFELLELLDLQYTNVSEFPKLDCPKMNELDIMGNKFTVPEDPFSHMPLLTWVRVSYTGGSTLPDVLFTGIHTMLNKVYIENDDVNHLQVGPFENVKVKYLLYLNFSNVLFDIEEKALTGLQEMYLEMWSTSVPTLEENLWRPVLNNNVILVVNEITCDCSIKWLVSNPQLIDKVQYKNDFSGSYQPSKCLTGKNLADLDPADFEDC